MSRHARFNQPVKPPEEKATELDKPEPLEEKLKEKPKTVKKPKK